MTKPNPPRPIDSAPWIFRRDERRPGRLEIVSKNPPRAGICDVYVRAGGDPEGEAHAALIKAAPDLLAAAEAVVATMPLLKNPSATHRVDPESPIWKRYEAARALRLAVAKARRKFTP